MFVKLKPFLLFPCPFVFMFIVFEAQWHLTPGNAASAAALGNLAVIIFLERIRESHRGSDHGEAPLNTALPKERPFVQKFGKALIYGAVFIVLIKLLETQWQLNHLRAAVAALCGTPLFIALFYWLSGSPGGSNHGEASLNTELQHPESSSKSVPESRYALNPYDPKETALVQKVSKAMMCGMGFIVLILLLESLWQMSPRRATVAPLCVTTLFIVVSLTYDRLHRNRKGKSINAV